MISFQAPLNYLARGFRLRSRRFPGLLIAPPGSRGILLLTLTGCSLGQHVDDAVRDGQRAERVVALEAARTLHDFSAVATGAQAVLTDARPRVQAILEHLDVATSRAWLVELVLVVAATALVAGVGAFLLGRRR